MDANGLLALDANADLWAVACNYRAETKIASDGARAFLVCGGSGSGHIDQMIRVRSRGGRWVTKWERARRLTDFRAACIPASHPMRGDTHIEMYPNRGAAEARAAQMMVVARREATAVQAR